MNEVPPKSAVTEDNTTRDNSLKVNDTANEVTDTEMEMRMELSNASDLSSYKEDKESFDFEEDNYEERLKELLQNEMHKEISSKRFIKEVNKIVFDKGKEDTSIEGVVATVDSELVEIVTDEGSISTSDSFNTEFGDYSLEDTEEEEKITEGSITMEIPRDSLTTFYLIDSTPTEGTSNTAVDIYEKEDIEERL